MPQHFKTGDKAAVADAASPSVHEGKRIAYSKAHTHTQQELDASKLFAECAAEIVKRGE